tara:strand:+ start:78 stop:767 length:690 start_codon:yes stop_codon:yes gene_type:complete
MKKIALIILGIIATPFVLWLISDVPIRAAVSRFCSIDGGAQIHSIVELSERYFRQYSCSPFCLREFERGYESIEATVGEAGSQYSKVDPGLYRFSIKERNLLRPQNCSHYDRWLQDAVNLFDLKVMIEKLDREGSCVSVEPIENASFSFLDVETTDETKSFFGIRILRTEFVYILRPEEWILAVDTQYFARPGFLFGALSKSGRGYSCDQISGEPSRNVSDQVITVSHR